MTPRFVARQLSFPRGIFGRVIVRMMNRANSNINVFALRQLELSAADRVLEIGFGGGKLLNDLVASAGFVAGVDRSPYAVKRANARFAQAVRDARAEFRQGSVDAIPFPDSSFTRVCTVHTVYFWNSLTREFEQIHRVLRPGGRAVVGFRPKEHMEPMGMPGDIFTLRTPEDVTAAMTLSGFRNIQIERPRPQTPWNVIVATRA